jgi:hypothetical protein
MAKAFLSPPLRGVDEESNFGSGLFLSAAWNDGRILPERGCQRDEVILLIF